MSKQSRVELREANRALARAEKAQAKADEREYKRNHAQLKRQQAFHATLLSAQVRRGRKQSRRES